MPDSYNKLLTELGRFLESCLARPRLSRKAQTGTGLLASKWGVVFSYRGVLCGFIRLYRALWCNGVLGVMV